MENINDNELKVASFAQKLKAGTSENHRLLELNSLLSALVSSDVTIHQYYCYLILMKEIVLFFEKAVMKRISVIIPLLEARESSAVIVEDVKSLGYYPPSLKSPCEYNLPVDLNSTGQLLGAMYVIEGSRLGGKVIYKNINKSLGFAEHIGARFIADYGFETGANWKKFLSLLTNYVAKNNIEEEAVAGANRTFESIRVFFEANHKFYDV